MLLIPAQRLYLVPHQEDGCELDCQLTPPQLVLASLTVLLLLRISTI
jgi:hypothetical protein